jgi:small subunit ribosomal protein S7
MRKRRKFKRIQPHDPKFGNPLVGKFINHVMKDGKKTIAERIVYDAFSQIQKTAGGDPVRTFETAIANAAPILEVRSRRIGGANYQVPIEVRPERRTTLAFRWILGATRSKRGKPMAVKLAEELLAASKNEGAAIKKKLDTHRMAEANKAFAHFAW